MLLADCARTRQPTITVLPANAVVTARVIPNGVAARGSNCEVRTLDKMPHDNFRELGTIRLSGVVTSSSDVITLLDQQACRFGADAIFIKQMQEQTAGDKVSYQVSAVAIGLGPDASAAAASEAAGSATDSSTEEREKSANGIEPADSAATLEAPVILMNPDAPVQPSGESDQGQAAEQPKGEASYGEGVAAEGASGGSGSTEKLMQPLASGAGDTNGDQTSSGGGESAAISESEIPPTKAAPLKVSKPASTPSPTPVAASSSPSQAPSATASPTQPTQASSPVPTMTPESSPSPSPVSETPTPSSSPTPSMSGTPSPSPSATPSPLNPTPEPASSSSTPTAP